MNYNLEVALEDSGPAHARIVEGWSEVDLNLVSEAPDFLALGRIAISVANKMPRPIVFVCGPITSGGRGSFEENRAVFTRAISLIQSLEISVFDQWPIEARIQTLGAGMEKRALYDQLFQFIFEPLIRFHGINPVVFLPLWHTSVGARRENDIAVSAQKKIVVLPDDFGYWGRLELRQRILGS